MSLTRTDLFTATVQSESVPARLPASARPSEVVASLRAYGYAIVENLAPRVTNRVSSELEPYFLRVPMGTGSFTGERTQRVARLLVRSSGCAELATHPLVLEAAKSLLAGQCYHPQLAMTQAVRVHPGQSAQELHRDDNVFPFLHPRPPTVLFSMWALSEFTERNGATRLIPCSHTWGDDVSPLERGTIAAQMAPGSVLLWEGATFHAAGANTSHDARTGALIGYSAAWLRQYENQYLAVPPELARKLSPELQDLLGYRNHGYLGTYENRDARELLHSPSLELPAPVDLFTPELEQLPRVRN